MTSKADSSNYVSGIIEVSEPTIAGEGPNVGRLITIIRFKECNLKCMFNMPDGTIIPCDTDNKMHGPLLEVTLEDIAIQVRKTQGIMFTGGESTIYINQIIEII